MTGKTHIVGGVALGIMTLHLSKISLTELQMIQWYGACAIGGLLPDIDHPNALINKYLLMIPYVLSGKPKHRTLTHSILFSIVSLIITLLMTQNMVITIGIFVGVWSHLLLDTLNPTGVPYLYPLSSRKYSVLRVHTGTAQELPVVLLCLVVSYFLLFPSEVHRFVSTLMHIS